MVLDVAAARRQFPALEVDDFIYFDNAGGAQVAGLVADRVRDYLLSTSVQHGGGYSKSRQAEARLYEAQTAVATLIGATRPEEVVMGPSTTALIRMLAGIYRKILKPGDEIVVSGAEHESNIGPWAALREGGITVRFWPIDRETTRLEPAALEGLLNERTRLVALTHVSNILGTINPVAEITAMAHKAGARVLVDGVAYSPHRLIDVGAWDVDYYVFSFYKMFGPHHAVLYGKYDDLLSLPGANHFFIGADAIPYKFQPGSANYELSWGVIGILDYLLSLGDGRAPEGDARARLAAVFDDIAEHEEALSARLLDFLNQRPEVTIIGEPRPGRGLRVPLVSFTVSGRDSAAIVAAVDEHDIGIRHGDFYAKKLARDLGIAGDGGAIRASLVHYNTLAEVDRFTGVLAGILDR